MDRIASDRFLLIIGAAKCGTTSLFAYLAQHPQIAASLFKEPEYFSRHQTNRKRMNRYEDLWPQFDPDRHRFAMEASTGYTKSNERGVAQAIHAHGLRPKLVYMVRDPFDRIESHYNFIRRDPARRLSITDAKLVQTSNYRSFADDYTNLFGRENLLVVDFVHLADDPLGCVNAICTFLGIDSMPALADTAARTVTARPMTAFEHRLRQIAPNAGRLVPHALHAPLRRMLLALRPEKRRLTPEQRAEIAVLLAPDMSRFAADYGIDVSRWGF